MANTLSAMMASFALTAGAPAPPPFLIPRDIEIEIRQAKFQGLDEQGGTAARGISISEETGHGGSEGAGITSAARDRAAASTRARAADSSRAAYRGIVSTLLRYLSLESNWDNDGGVAPQISTIGNAMTYLSEVSFFARPPRVFVVGDGEVGFAWESPTGYAQIGFHNDDEIVVIARTEDGRRDVRGEYKTLVELPRVALRDIIRSL
jgi:hypothetical protein